MFLGAKVRGFWEWLMNFFCSFVCNFTDNVYFCRKMCL